MIMMASKTLLPLSILVTMAAALVPPCLPDLGPRFCPSDTVLTIPYDYVPVAYPEPGKQQDILDKAFARLNKTRMEHDLKILTSPIFQPNRFCNSSIYGPKALTTVTDLVAGVEKDIKLSGNGSSSIRHTSSMVENQKTPQKSFIYTVVADPGADIVVLGAHFDSINHPQFDIPDSMIAPGADDNGSGTVVLIEVLRALLPLFAERPVLNEVQFHWYAAEEIGLVGSTSVFAKFRNESRPVKAMLNLDMVGYSGAHDAGSPKVVAVQGDDFIDKELTAFTKKLVGTYSQAKVGDMACNYLCSDHAAAHEYGFPSAMIGESSYIRGPDGGKPKGYPWIHSENDTIDHVDFDYMLEFAKVAAAFIVELAYTNLTAL